MKMTLKAHNLVSGSSVIRFVVWSRKGSGMVNVYTPGDAGGDMMSIEGARKYWQDMIAKHGYSRGEDCTVQPC